MKNHQMMPVQAKKGLFGTFPVIIHWLVCVKDREAEGAFRTKTQLGEHWARWG